MTAHCSIPCGAVERGAGADKARRRLDWGGPCSSAPVLDRHRGTRARNRVSKSQKLFRYLWRVNAILILVAAGAITLGVGVRWTPVSRPLVRPAKVELALVDGSANDNPGGAGCGSCGKRAAFSKVLWASGPFRSSIAPAASTAPKGGRTLTASFPRVRQQRTPAQASSPTRTSSAAAQQPAMLLLRK
jgi:hypothetical protein